MRKHLSEAMERYPDAANEIAAWAGIVKEVRWHNFDEVRGMFKDADNVDGYVIFDIRRNRYRLITVIHYAKTTKEMQTKGHVYARSFLTQRQQQPQQLGQEVSDKMKRILSRTRQK